MKVKINFPDELPAPWRAIAALWNAATHIVLTSGFDALVVAGQIVAQCMKREAVETLQVGRPNSAP